MSCEPEENHVNEGQLDQWINEQHNIARQVNVLPDNDLESNNGQDLVSEMERYKKVSLCMDNSRWSLRTKLYGGVDVSFPGCENKNDPAVAVYTIMKGSDLVYKSHEFFELSVPYVSSFLSFREIEPLEKLVKKQIMERPDLTPNAILVDGNGIMHVRRAGIASFLGVRTGIPTIGVGKTLYCHDGITVSLVNNGLEKRVRNLHNTLESMVIQDGVSLFIDHFTLKPSEKFEEENGCVFEDKLDMKEVISKISNKCGGLAVGLEGNSRTTWGAVLVGHGGEIRKNKRKMAGTKNPIFISVGHNISLHRALQICTELSFSRIPEPVRIADLSGRELIRNYRNIDLH